MQMCSVRVANNGPKMLQLPEIHVLQETWHGELKLGAGRGGGLNSKP